MRVLFSFTIIAVIIVRMFLVFSHAGHQTLDRSELREKWLHSQYNLDRGFEFYGNISDEDLYTYAALEYVSGTDPTAINFEHPPLGKYLLGLSYLITGNILVVVFLASILVLLVTWKLGSAVGLTKTAALIPPLVLAFDPLFAFKSTTVNLDLLQLLFILLSLLVLISPRLDTQKIIFLGISIGSVMATKGPIVIGALVLLLSGIVFYRREKRTFFKQSLLLLLVSLFIYSLSYVGFFLSHSFPEFFHLHLRVFRFYRSYLPEYPWFEIWRILLLGRWRTWFADPPIQFVDFFWIAWPLGVLGSASLLWLRDFWRKNQEPVGILLAFLGIYLGFQSTHVIFPRHVLIALPILFILSVVAVYGFAATHVSVFGSER